MTVEAAPRLVPEGNRHAEQPPVPGASSRRTAGSNTTFERKYQRIVALLASDETLRDKIRKVARQYGIAPIHMVGALVGEHTYNVDAYDRLQAYYVKAVAYAGERFQFGFEGENVLTFVARSEFANCGDADGSYRLWSCRERVWDTSFRGRAVNGQRFPDDRFSAVFFQPFFAGQTFGLGQINPLTALKMTDRVARISGFKRVSADDPIGVYQAIMDPDQSLAYMAAIISNAIELYRRVANFDISGNPGLTATLYNVGDADLRAAVLASKSRNGKQAVPEENYYGWLVNDRLDELRALFPES
nr:DUF1402 family protein [Pararhizobium haloflavum]